jgi:anaerobic selenocysteine-containing dehydrogenase
MKLTRRNFLAWAGLSAVGAVACEGFGIREGELSLQSSTMLPEDLVKGQDNWYATLCRSCPCAEGIVVRVMDGRAKKVQGNPLYPINHGKQSARCEAGLQAVYHPDRVSGPMRRSGPRGSGHFTPISWKDVPGITGPSGLGTLGQQLQDRGQDSLLITEPLRGHLALVAERFANAVGGKHLGFETLDNNTYRTAVKKVFGQDTLPDFDLANTGFLLSFGADFLSTWVSPTRWSQGYGEFRQGDGRNRGTFYQVDTRFSMTAANADKWIPINPGWEGHLALSLAYVIISENLHSPGVDVAAMTNGQREVALDAFRPETVAQKMGLTEEMLGLSPAEFIVSLAKQFAGSRSSLAIGGGSAGAYNNGLFNLEAIYALNHLVGNSGVRFNPGSPLEDVPASANVGTLADWEEANEAIRSGKTRLLMLHNADPVHGLPGSLNLARTLDQADDLFVVSFSPFIDETSVWADLILPDRMSLEDWGDDIPEPGPGYQMLGFQQPVVNPLHDLDPLSFPDVMLTVAQELGKDAGLPWDNYQKMLREGSDALFAMNRGSIKAGSAAEFWNSLLQKGGWWDERATASAPSSPPSSLFNEIAAELSDPRFNNPSSTGKEFFLVPFSHHTLLDGRNGHIPWLQATPDPLTTITWQTWVEMNDTSAAELGLREGDVVSIESSSGSIRALLYPTPAVPPQVIGVPLGQGRRHGSEYASGRAGIESSNVLDILAAERVEGSDSLAWAGTRVTVSGTGASMKVSKFEGNERAVEIGVHEGERIILTVPDEPS